MIERSLGFGPGGGLIGTVCLPAQPAAGAPGIGFLLFNAGVVHRIGPHRINVRLARRLAAGGIPSIRFDLAGQGDSFRPSGEHSFETQIIVDLRAAMDALQAEAGVTKFALFGFCSGGYQGYPMALAEERIAGLLIFDAFLYPSRRSRFNRYAMRIRQHGLLRAVGGWSRRAVTAATRRAVKLFSRDSAQAGQADEAYFAGLPSKAEFAGGLHKLRDRGVKVGLIYSGGGFEHYNYARQFEEAFAGYGIAGRVTIRFLPDMDHVATGVAAQAELMAHVERWGMELDREIRSPAGAAPATTSAAASAAGGLPPAIVLSKAVTGLATIRALAEAGIEVHCIYFDAHDPVRFSRCCEKIYFDEAAGDEEALLALVVATARRLGNRPVVFPSCDAHALLLARNLELLEPLCRIWNNSHANLLHIISKDGLYGYAEAANLPTVPSIIASDPAAIAAWSADHAAPYLIKPFYEGIASSSLHRKNLLVQTREDLLEYVEQFGTESVIVQRMLRGGDGYIFDCYGYCDAGHRIVTLASHRRWRQFRPDFGTTCYGQIPADPAIEAQIFEYTARLLEGAPYHGIFGVEWLLERETGNFYLIDFNARPFTTLGHLSACGLNLPALAYHELCGRMPPGVERTPRLRHLMWADLLRDMESFQEKNDNGAMEFSEWLRSIMGVRSFAYIGMSDPGPGLSRVLLISRKLLRFALRKAGLRKGVPPA